MALIPPVSGGTADRPVVARVCTEAIETDHVRRLVAGDRRTGAVVTFEGTTRGETDPVHGPLIRLEYEAYASMAERELARLAEEAAARWSPIRIAVTHRVGAIPVGEVSVVIAVAAAHRGQAFEACRWLIDAVKKEVPIWKKDVFEDGHVRWVQTEVTSVKRVP
ncbi:MAG: molybdenum cofactor biosynthesis protein MoaE [Phycisphaerae bacterium]